MMKHRPETERTRVVAKQSLRQLKTHPENPVRLPRRVIDNAMAIYTSVTTAVTVSMDAGIFARARLAARIGFCTLPGENKHD